MSVTFFYRDLVLNEFALIQVLYIVKFIWAFKEKSWNLSFFLTLAFPLPLAFSLYTKQEPHEYYSVGL